MVNKQLRASMILGAIRQNEKVRVSDIASRLYISKQTARRALNIMVIMGVLQMEKYHYAGNTDICVYSVI